MVIPPKLLSETHWKSFMFSWNENLHQFLNLHYVKDHFISEYWWASSLGSEAMCILLLLSAVLWSLECTLVGLMKMIEMQSRVRWTRTSHPKPAHIDPQVAEQTLSRSGVSGPLHSWTVALVLVYHWELNTDTKHYIDNHNIWSESLLYYFNESNLSLVQYLSDHTEWWSSSFDHHSYCNVIHLKYVPTPFLSTHTWFTCNNK